MDLNGRTGIVWVKATVTFIGQIGVRTFTINNYSPNATVNIHNASIGFQSYILRQVEIDNDIGKWNLRNEIV